MDKKFKKIISIIIPNKNTAYFTIFIMSLGIISGSIFLVLISQSDKQTVIEQITTFFSNINSNNINNIQTLKNSLLINYVYIFLIWILGMSIIGILFNIFLIYFKGFTIGFSIASLIYVHGVKGMLSSLIYLFPNQLLNIFVIFLVGIYSIYFTKNLYKFILGNKTINFKTIIKKYFYILILCVIVALFSSLIETFVTPAIFKLVIKLFI